MEVHEMWPPLIEIYTYNNHNLELCSAICALPLVILLQRTFAIDDTNDNIFFERDKTPVIFIQDIEREFMFDHHKFQPPPWNVLFVQKGIT